ncbi:hypothetical protein RUM43_003254 [Polyplax serrata]|uniref:Uncharacterized protein n=1 Tax=Polyplax serrata TaxID=468196 RepID=A0AAN8S5G3_POLSC
MGMLYFAAARTFTPYLPPPAPNSPGTRARHRGNRRLTRNESRYHSGTEHVHALTGLDRLESMEI